MSSTVQEKTPAALLARALKLEGEMLDWLEKLVRIESPSDDKRAVDHAVEWTARWAEALGGRVKLHEHARFGNTLEARFGEPRRAVEQPAPGRLGSARQARSGRQSGSARMVTEKPVLLLGHLDTVWERGTLARMPWRVTRERVFGPGVLDMKAGVVMIFTALAILLEKTPLRRPVRVLLNADEEIGSPATRRRTEAVARECRAVYVLEPAQGEAGAYKTARKGVGQYRLEVEGIAAHSGLDFDRGHSATTELARQIEALERMAGPRRGKRGSTAGAITMNAGVIGGGTRSNVVAARAWAEIDVRVPRLADQARVEHLLRSLRPRDSGCVLHWSGGWNRPPMERTPATVALFRRARALASEMGIALEEAASGGGSDGSFTAALGAPTLDGMGAVGAGAHAPEEHCLRRHLAPRTALLAAMLQ